MLPDPPVTFTTPGRAVPSWLVTTTSNEGLLRQGARAVEPDEFTPALAALVDTLHAATVRERGCGLAAPQLGVLLRVAVIHFGRTRHALVNPRIVERKGAKVRGEEGCLSVPGRRVSSIPRSSTVTVEYQDAHGARRRLVARGWLARIVQHELDHLDGVLITDYAPTVDTARRGAAC